MDFHGVIVYEITQNAGWLILNGMYCNNDHSKYGAAFEINNQIAKKWIEEDERDILEGEYTVSYIDSDLTNGKLAIRRSNEAYEMSWYGKQKGKNKHLFNGVGVRCGQNHFAVSFVKAGK